MSGTKSSLVSILNATINNYSDADEGWRQFISDHKTYLRNSAQARTITPSFMQGVKYNLAAYLRNINFPTYCAWIVQMINDFPNDVEFTSDNVGLIYIPNFYTIQGLYTTYATTQNT